MLHPPQEFALSFSHDRKEETKNDITFMLIFLKIGWRYALTHVVHPALGLLKSTSLSQPSIQQK
jgi:hypothetical protein